METQKHMNLAVGCGDKHGEFEHHTETNRLICGVCGEDFTQDAENIYLGLKIALDK